MDSRSKLAVAVVLMALAMFSIAGVLSFKYFKVADYVCYYGEHAPGSYEAVVGGGPAGHPVNGSLFVGGVWSNPDDLHCYKNTNNQDFVCPSRFDGGKKFLGNQYVTDNDIKSFL